VFNRTPVICCTHYAILSIHHIPFIFSKNVSLIAIFWLKIHVHTPTHPTAKEGTIRHLLCALIISPPHHHSPTASCRKECPRIHCSAHISLTCLNLFAVRTNSASDRMRNASRADWPDPEPAAGQVSYFPLGCLSTVLRDRVCLDRVCLLTVSATGGEGSNGGRGSDEARASGGEAGCV